ncbi:MAG: triose-phosphate isomerase [Candidatus Obscuribacterales bacterium]|nr:triose-phosphate isomerase [Candidatus Obscuribacterales bacterium]
MSDKVRKTIIAGNWKMNKLRKEASELASALVAGTKGKENLPEIVLCPPFTCLDVVVAAAKGSPVKVGAQNVDHRDSGAFTGEIAPPMLVDCGASYVIIGHSERRQFFGETNQTVPLRVKAALNHGLTPIVCVGELLDERENELTDPVVKRQVGAAVTGLTEEEILKLVFAYEPVWAIGTGKVCESKEAARVVALVRSTLKASFQNKETAEQVPVLYGGSMSAKNAEELLAQDEIDGGLIGGASLKADEFLEIINHACKRPRLSATKA